jgi:hypothetical protein
MRFEAAVDELLNYEQTAEVAFPDVDFSGLREMYAALLRLRRERVTLDGRRGQEQLRSAVHLIMSMPEFQLH